jgi:hypothetical protein
MAAALAVFVVEPDWNQTDWLLLGKANPFGITPMICQGAWLMRMFFPDDGGVAAEASLPGPYEITATFPLEARVILRHESRPSMGECPARQTTCGSFAGRDLLRLAVTEMLNPRYSYMAIPVNEVAWASQSK